MIKKILLAMAVMAAAFVAAGCGGKSDPKAEKPAESVSNVVDYGIGATQIKAKKNMENKLQQINQQHNRAVEDALAE
ncbi:MAG: hypothetical protein J6S21_03860 [Victivallales bacterium]|nr:hypothetical protein [Victivallales bacterium]